MSIKPYILYTEEQLSKIGNTVLYIAERVEYLSKTKLLKLLYILDEFSIKKGGIPFLNLTYKVWKYGPVSEELFVDLSSSPTLLRNYIKKEIENGNEYIKPNATFSDDEFSDNDIELMDDVIQRFGRKNANELTSYTHRENAPWYTTAKKNNILDELMSERLSNTEFVIDLSCLIEYDPVRKEIYTTYLEYN